MTSVFKLRVAFFGVILFGLFHLKLAVESHIQAYAILSSKVLQPDVNNTTQVSQATRKTLFPTVIKRNNTTQVIQATRKNVFPSVIKGNDTVKDLRTVSPTSPIRSATSEIQEKDLLIPMSIMAMLSPSVNARLSIDIIANKCRFDAVKHEYEKRRAGGANGTVTLNCLTGCGGTGDRLRGISATLVRALSLGYNFRLEMNKPVPLRDVFTERGNVLWLSPRRPELADTFRVDALDKGDFKFCEWSRHTDVFVRTNLPGLIGADGHFQNESCHSQHQFYKEPLMRSRGWDMHKEDWYAMTGCSFWYLFSFGKHLQHTLSQELQRFHMWRIEHGRERNPIVGVHIRSGDTAMLGVGFEHDVRVGSAGQDGAIRIMECALKWSTVIGLQNATFFVVSDTIESRAFATSRFPGRVFPSSAVPFHTDRSHKGDLLKGTLSSWMDLLLLAFSDAIVLSRSGFGEAASHIGMFSQDRVLTPAECIHKGLVIVPSL